MILALLGKWKTQLIIAGLVIALTALAIWYIYAKGEASGAANVERKLQNALDKARAKLRQDDEELARTPDDDLDNELRQ